VQALLLVGLYQLLYTRVPAHAAIGETVGCADKLKKPWAKALLNAVLRRAQREGEALLAGWSATRWCAPPTRAGCKNP
jgi:16S rRNA (cytosine967-C5)-methyltransferase